MRRNIGYRWDETILGESPKGKDKIIIVIVRIVVRRAGWGVPEVKASPRDGN